MILFTVECCLKLCINQFSSDARVFPWPEFFPVYKYYVNIIRDVVILYERKYQVLLNKQLILIAAVNL